MKLFLVEPESTSTEEISVSRLAKVRERLFQSAHGALIFSLGALILGGLYALDRWLSQEAAWAKESAKAFSGPYDQILQARDHYASARDLKVIDVEQFKAGFSGQAKS